MSALASRLLMKKYFILSLSALALTTSCVSSLSDDYNVDPKSPTSALSSGLVANAERSLVRDVVSANVNTNPFRFYVQYWAATDYPAESRYDINTRSIAANFWNPIYRDCLRDLREAKATIPTDVAVPAASKNNALAVVEVLEIYAWATLVETYGNVPYSESLDFANARPKYEDQKVIYNDLISRLDAVIGKFNTSVPTGLGANELLYPGTSAASTALWVKFANAMKLRMALVIADDDAAKAKTMAEATVNKLPASNTESADLTFNGTFPNTNPLYEDLVRSNRADFVGSSFFINRLKGTDGPATGVVDPRLNDYFDPIANTTNYEGGVYGSTNLVDDFATPGAKLKVQTLPGVLISYAQVELMLAEAVERGFAVGGTAASHYNAGVIASIAEWGGTADEANTYLSQPQIAYSTAPGGYKQKIGYQYWLALYNQPTEAWTQWRRLDYPQLTAPSNAFSAIPLRLLYPVVEQNLNNVNYAAAAAAIGGDAVTTKLFWDKF
jgi:hypothetical protein